jgi:hypothetical protein
LPNILGCFAHEFFHSCFIDKLKDVTQYYKYQIYSEGYAQFVSSIWEYSFLKRRGFSDEKLKVNCTKDTKILIASNHYSNLFSINELSSNFDDNIRFV